MAGYREHISVSGLCGGVYGAAALLVGFTPAQAALAGVLAWVGGMLPDLDSNSGKPVREIFSLIGAVVPMIAIRHLVRWCGTVDGAILAAVLIYAAIRYGGAALLKRISVHRGMFHSLPALLIAAELVFLGYVSDSVAVKLLMAGGVALGFFSHLMLDEFYSVQWSGMRFRLSKSAGSAIKLFGKKFVPNVFAYGLLCLLTWMAFVEVGLVEDPYQRMRATDEALQYPLRHAAQPGPPRH